MPERRRNIAASVRARLLNIAREKGLDFQLVLTRYALERLLHRLSQTDHRDRYILKGAMLLASRFDAPMRPTRDLDFLGHGDSSPDHLLEVFHEICAVEADDGLEFDADGLAVDRIREDTDYGGVRLTTRCTLDGARIKIVVDIGFGDAMEPEPDILDVPVLLDDLPAPRIRAYALETVVAEKFEAMVTLGLANTRIKDYFDLWTIFQLTAFDDERLARAIGATFERRGTIMPTTTPDGLSEAYASDTGRQQQWNRFVDDLLEDPISLIDVTAALSSRLMPIVKQARHRSGY